LRDFLTWNSNWNFSDPSNKRERPTQHEDIFFI
jgi:hypothetical protein